jgi:hypothetical protein
MPAPDWKRLVADPKIRAVAIAVPAGACIALAWWGFHVSALPPAVPPPPPAASAPVVPPAQADAGAAKPVAATAPPEPLRENARITFVTSPPAHATVSWGKVRLGVITPKQALVVVRPRDSGPLDVVVRAPGYMQVTTRAHTFGDSRIIVKLTTLEQKSTLLGYKTPIDAGPPDAGEALLPPETIAPPPLP